MPQLAIAVTGLNKQYQVPQNFSGFWGGVKSFFNRQYTLKKALENINFTINTGECVGLLGANGAGKTTLIKIMSGLIVPTIGEVQVLGFSPQKREYVFLKSIGVVMGQKQQMWIDISGLENLKLLRVIYSIPQNDFNYRLKKIAQMLDVEALLHVPVRKLSLGEKMKMELVAAFIPNPRLLFLDEPTIGLDVLAQNTIRNFIKHQVQNEGVTVLLTSHYMKDLEELCPRALLIQDGKLVHDGNLRDIAKGSAARKRIIFSTSHSHVERIWPDFNLKKMLDGHWCIEVPTQQVSSIMAQVMTLADIDDLSVEAIPLEEVFLTLLKTRNS